MADRNDPTQYRDAVPAGPQPFPDTSVTDQDSQSVADGVYADATDLVGYHDHGTVPDLLHQQPGLSYSQPEPVTRETGQPYPFAVSGPVYFDAGYIAGFTVRETSGAAAAVVNLRDGSDASAPLLATIALPSGTGAQEWFLPGGIKFTRGLYVDVAAGSAIGVVYTARTITL